MRRKYTPHERGELMLIQGVIENEGHDVDELCSLLELTVDDIIERFQDRLLERRELFIAAAVEIEPVIDDEEEDETPEGSW